MITGFVLGILFGFVLQRGRFCITGAFRDLYIARNSKMLVALLIAISVQSIGFFTLRQTGLITVEPASNLALTSVVTGSLLFGFGIVLAGGCATGTWYRAGEGLVGSWIALIVYMLFSAMMRTGVLSAFNSAMHKETLEHTAIYTSLNISPWVLVVLLSSVTALLAWRHIRRPQVKIAQLPAKKTGLAHILFEKRWHPFITATLIGLIAILAWPLSLATGREFGLGITAPSANIMQYLITGDSKFINWGVFLVVGILFGSLIAARLSNEFRIRVPNVKTVVYSAIGGGAMGIGASLAGGCSIGNGLVETAFFSWQGWISLPMMILGTWIAAYLTMVLPKKTVRHNENELACAIAH